MLAFEKTARSLPFLALQANQKYLKVIMNITYQPLHPEHFKLLYDWIAQPHVAAWWSDPHDWEIFLQKYSEKIESPYRGCFIIEIDQQPIGYIQWYQANKFPEWQNQPDGTYGVDLYIGNLEFIGKGYGTQIVKQFVRLLLKKPNVTNIIANPDISNTAAIRCYEKAGFKKSQRHYKTKQKEILLNYQKDT